MDNDEKLAHSEESVVDYTNIIVALEEAAYFLESCFRFISNLGEHFKDCFFSDILDAAECFTLNYLAYTLVLHIFN